MGWKQHPALEQTEHRPWPMPGSPWLIRQSWSDLLFAHWRVPVDKLQPLVPPGLHVQEFDGSSWVGIVPFRMQDVSGRWLPNIPGLSTFPETNVRIYVEANGKPGVWFLSLDATQSLVVRGARRFFGLPYHKASIDLTMTESEVRHVTHRTADAKIGFSARYRPREGILTAAEGSLDHWLTERYCLYTVSPAGDLERTEVHHRPWPLQNVEAEVEFNTLASDYGIDLPGQPCLLHYSKRVDVINWLPTQV